MIIHSAKNRFRVRRLALSSRAAVTVTIVGLALISCGAALADTVPQFGVTAVNAKGNSLYNVTLAPNATPNTGALITGTSQLNTDAAGHGAFFAVVRAPNSSTSALDLIVADAIKRQIVRYAGPGPAYAPSNTIFSYTGNGSGPSVTTGLAVDSSGNLYAASAGIPFESKPALWAIPFNKTAGTYGAPVLIDNIFGGLINLSVAEVVVANVGANPVGNAAPAWNQGDVLVLIDACLGGARVLVYSQAAIAAVLDNPSVPLTAPTSVLIAPSAFGGERPTGLDLWPADSTYPASGHGVSLLLPTADGRVMRFDSAANAFSADFANGLGAGLLKIKVGIYSTFPYAFLGQSSWGINRILQFGAPPSSGPNSPLASVSMGVNDPQGLAVSSSSSQPVGDCIAPNICAPLGPEITTQITTTNLNPNNPLLEQSCTVNTDPRVTASVAQGTWSCAGGTIDVANFCPGFPSTILPGSMCGHSGPTGAGFVVVKTTAIAVDQDPNINNSFIEYAVDPNLPLPGPLNLNCPQVPMFAWAPRSDLPNIEGTIPEGNTFIDLSSFCDSGGGHTHVASMIAFGLGLNSAVNPASLPQGLPGFVDDKFANLTQTITNAGAQINDGGTTQAFVTQAKSYFDSGVTSGDANAYGCAMNTLANAESYVRGTPSSFSGLPPPGNPNPAGDIDGRLGNLFLSIDVDFLLQPPNQQWPTSNVPPCMTLTATPASVVAPGAAQLTWSSGTGSYPAASCVLSASNGAFTSPTIFTGASGSASTGTLNQLGTYSAQLICSSASGNTITSFTQTTISVVQLSAINITPSAPPPQIAAGGTVQLTATGVYTDQSTKNVTGQVMWTSADTSIATVSSGGLVTCVSTALTGAQVVVSAIGSTAAGSVQVLCLAPTLNSITLTPQNPTLTGAAAVQLTATANYSFGPPQNITSSATWSTGNANLAMVSAGLVTCVAGANGPATISAVSGGATASTTVNCQAPVLLSISVTPQSHCEIGNGRTQQLTAIGTYSSGPPKNLTNVATWTSGAPSIATVSSTGLVSCKHRNTYSDGGAIISATVGSKTGSTEVNCEGLRW